MGFSIDQERRDSINREIATKEIRVLDINAVMSAAAQLKKELTESGHEQGSVAN